MSVVAGAFVGGKLVFGGQGRSGGSRASFGPVSFFFCIIIEYMYVARLCCGTYLT